MNLFDHLKDVYNIDRCHTCNFVDLCKFNTDYKHRDLPPLSKRGKERICFVCKHPYWHIERDRKIRTCMTPSCGLCLPLNADSAKIKHQR